MIELGYELTAPGKHTKDGWYNTRIPEDVGKLALKKLESIETALRPIAGFCTMPLLLEDGTINTAQGYHEPSQLYCHGMPDILVPERPTRQDAEAALQQLRYAFRTFPFADSPTTTETITVDNRSSELQVVDLEQPAARDESSFLAMLMTSVCRRSMKLAPALALTAPDISGAGTGKGMLIRAIGIVGTGTVVHVNSLGRGPELEKGTVAALLQPDPMIVLDNLNKVVLRSQSLCTTLTENPSRVRLFGTYDNPEINTRAFIALNGNGLRIGEDLVRKVVTVEFDAKVENPELRDFPGDFLEDIAAARADLLAGILTIWRWGRLHRNRLQRGLPLGSYSQWADWMRDVLVTLGCRDPVERVETAKANDAGRLYTLSIFEARWEQFETDVKTARDAYDNEKVRQAIEGGQLLTRQKFASKLSSLIGVRVGGYAMESPNKAEKEQAGSKKKFVPYTYRLLQT